MSAFNQPTTETMEQKIARQLANLELTSDKIVSPIKERRNFFDLPVIGNLTKSGRLEQQLRSLQANLQGANVCILTVGCYGHPVGYKLLKVYIETNTVVMTKENKGNNVFVRVALSTFVNSYYAKACSISIS